MLIEKRQRAIIKKICLEQEKSYLRILETRVKVIKEELRLEGYEVSESDILVEISNDLSQWDRAKENPDHFLQILDDANVGLIKHHLVNFHLNKEASKNIWQKINLNEDVHRFPN